MEHDSTIIDTLHTAKFSKEKLLKRLAGLAMQTEGTLRSSRKMAEIKEVNRTQNYQYKIELTQEYTAGRAQYLPA